MLPLAILAGGLATRLGSLTAQTPKSMIDICGKPFIYWQLKLIQESGFERVVICVGHLHESITEYLSGRKEFELDLQFSLDGPEKLGTGGAIQRALPKLGDSFAVIYGDSYLPINFSDIEQKFLNSSKLGLMTVKKNMDVFHKNNTSLLNDRVLEYSKSGSANSLEFIDYGFNCLSASSFQKDGFSPLSIWN